MALVLVIALLTPGCDATGDNGAQEDPENDGIELTKDEPGNNIHDDFAAVADEIPDFGGFYLNESGQPTVYLRDPQSDRRDDVRAVLQNVFGDDILTRGDSPRRPVATPQLELREGAFPMADLLTWFDRLPDVFTIDEVVLIDLHEQANRLTVGVTDVVAAEAVADRLADLDVPREAVSIEEVDPPEVQGHDLLSSIRPPEGGVEIGGPTGCTLGFAGHLDGSWGFITNSHCTAQRGSVTGATFVSPSGGSPIGQETADPAYNACFLGAFSCRFSDAAFVAYNSGTSAVNEVAHTQGWAAPNSGSGSLDINHGSPSLPIVGTESHPVGGEMLDKVGKKTGWTYGFVNRTCVMLGPTRNGNPVQVNGNRALMRCQNRATYTSNSGDSGSPVFRWHGDEVTLYGIHWGGGGSFSSMWGIRRDLL